LWGRCFIFWTGSLSRKEYTILVVTAGLLTFGTGIAFAVLHAVRGATVGEMRVVTRDMDELMRLLWTVCGIPPVFGGTVKRLRDVGKTAWYMLAFLLPCAGFAMMVYLMFERGARDAQLQQVVPERA